MNGYRTMLSGNSSGGYTVAVTNNGTRTLLPGSAYCAQQGNTSLNSNIVIGNNVNNCAHMLEGCTALNYAVTIGNNVTNCAYMFNGCHKFNQSVSIPNSVTNAMRMFYNCYNLNKNITVTNNVTNSVEMFGLCASFNQNVLISANVTNCHNMFRGCQALNQNIQIPNNVTDTSGMFAYCYNFNKNSIIPDSVTNCANMFIGCNNLWSYNANFIPNNAVNLKNLSGMFAYCSNLHSGGKSIHIPANATDCSYMLYNCSLWAGSWIYFDANTNTNINVYNMLNGILCSNTTNTYVYYNGNALGNLAAKGLAGPSANWTAVTNGYYCSDFNIYLRNNKAT